MTIESQYIKRQEKAVLLYSFIPIYLKACLNENVIISPKTSLVLKKESSYG
jgi:hypothetical protein